MNTILSHVTSVRKQLQKQWIWQCATTGLFVGGIVGFILAMSGLLAESRFEPVWILLVLMIPLSVGIVRSFLRPKSDREAAEFIDQTYGLKDRIQTSLQFLDQHRDDAFHRLQFEDAASHLARISPADHIKVKAPRLWNSAVILSVMSLLPGMMPSLSSHPTVPGLANPVVSAQVAVVSEGISELAKLQEELADPELESLLKELNQQLQTLAAPETKPVDAMASLSEMQASLQELQKRLGDTATEARMQDIGSALSLASPMAAAGDALAKGDLEKAADELDRLTLPTLDRETKKAIVENLDRKSNESSENSSKSNVEKSAKKMADGLNKGDSQTFQEGAKELAKEARRQEQKKQLSSLLKQQNLQLAEAKATTAEELKTTSAGAAKGGNRAGQGSDNDPVGTLMASGMAQKELKLTGQSSEAGDTEKETMSDSEQSEQSGEAARQYQQMAKKYEALSESVLESESIPLGHRQIIRRYFELIRPDDSESAEKQQQ